MDESGIIRPTVEEIEMLIKQRNLAEIKEMLSRVHPADIADLLDELAPEDAVTLFELLPLEVASEVLDETGSPIRQQLVDKVDDERLADLLDELPMDDAAEFLYDLPDPISDRLMELMEPEEAAEVQELLAYEDETAGRLMTRDVTALRRHWTVEETFAYLRSIEDAETLHYLYVIDRDEKLIGVVPLRTLILAQPEYTIDTIMITEVVSVLVTADQEELAEMVSRYDFFVMPVVDEENHLLGVVTVDDVLDIIEEEVTEDIQRLGGSEPLEQPYFAVSAWQMVNKRVGWLMLLFLAAVVTVNVLSFFETQMKTAIALSFFIPLVTGTGGNAGSQTVATIIRAITLGEVRLSNLWQTWRREIFVALILGLIMGTVSLGVAFILGNVVGIDVGLDVAAVVASTLPIVVLWAITIATIVPIIANQLGIDPTVISGPMITTIVDASALFIYFMLARAILHI